MSWWNFGKKKVGLVLGGGVARGIAHIGVLKVLLANKIPLDYVVASSSGSLVGAAFASGMDIALIEQVALRIRWSAILKLTFFQPGFSSAEAIEEFVNKYIGTITFSELKIPFSVAATDVQNGGLVEINSGFISRAIAASSAFPGFFSPVEINGRHLIDGSIAANVPVYLARKMGAEYVIASDVVPLKYFRPLPADPLSSLGRSLDLILKKLSYAEAHSADTLIELKMEDEDIWHMDLHKAEKLITAGEIAAHRSIHKIKKALGIQAGN